MLAECACPRLPHVEATYEMPDEFVVVCDYVPGQNLEELVRSSGRMGEKDARQIVSQLCEAAGALHAHNIVHRDISPRNVIVAADGAHLIDLGIARFRSEDATHDTTQLGTVGFASPEQHGFAQTDARSDVYSIGRVLGYLLTGVMPEVPDAADYERALSDEGVVSPRMRAVIDRACALEPSARFQSAAELADALSGKGEPSSSSAPTSGEKNLGAPPAPVSPVTSPAPRAASGGRGGASLVRVVGGLVVLLALLAGIVLVLQGTGVLEMVLGAGDTAQSSQPAQPDRSTGQGDAAGAGATGGSVTDAPVPVENPLEVVESGWSVDGQGFVHYAFGLRNNGDLQVLYPGVTVTGRDASGGVLFSQEQILSVVPAGQTVYFSSLAGSGSVPETVEVTPIQPEDYNVGPEADTAATFTISGLRAVSNGFGGYNFVGEITTDKAAGADDFGSQVAITVILRDESGAIVYGSTDFASRPDAGQTAAFEVMAMGDLPAYASMEAYALQW
nr:serine/threonine-protein kinase [Olsenella profusa]